ncbi:MAG: helicase-exonuclease AddAB subunit AddA [Lachnospiraceae bacterium]|nr:helicase-exonuclease AddAB subunit AddA [Lachnospiraceae bacterium]
MAVKFTPEQQKVIDLRKRNILVSAAAGSGKTAVLVERIIGMITDKEHPVDVDRLLVVTFTNAAAAEMRERISQAIDKRLLQEPENVHLQKQASLLHNAQITTIDSFCLFLIRNNFNDIGLDPGFRVADEGELRLIRQDVMTELLEEKYQEKEEAFTGCVEYFTGGSNDRLLEEYIGKLYEFSMSYPWPEDWIYGCMNDYKISCVTELEDAQWCKYLVTYVQTVMRECKSHIDAAIRIVERPDGPYMYGEMLEKEREMIGGLLGLTSFQAYYEAFDKISFGRLSSKKDDSVNPIARERVKELRGKVKKLLEAVKASLLLLSPEQVVERMQKAAPHLKELLLLALSYKEKLDARKRRDNIIDFHDMEHFALNILLKKTDDGSYIPSPAALEYRQFFEEILIDEYQDSNLVQELLLKSISGEEDGKFNRFMVGDVKQSIYRFRLARPELFMEKYACYSKEDAQCQRINLHKNFRSRSQVLKSVNDLFERIMIRELGGVEYDEEAALYPGASFVDLEQKDGQSFDTEYLIIGKDPDSAFSSRAQEASVIAAKIKKMHSTFQVTDKETGMLRPIRYSDMVILLRTTAGWAEEFRSVLERAGIPAYVALRTGYFQAVEIKILMQYLNVIDNPLQDIPLYGTLKSFFGGFTEEELALIRAENKNIPLYDLLLSYEGDLCEKIHSFLERLVYYRRKTTYTPIHKLIQEIVVDTGYLDYVTARPGGEQRRANVEMLLIRAATFENTSYYGLFHFLRYVEQLEKYEVDYGEADILDENADVVRIMSIHKSKGLEFPVCFLGGLTKKFNMQDISGRLIADADMGIGVDYIDSDLRFQSHTLKKNVVALKMKIDALGEEMRVLYVAMTRAKEKLILTAMVPDIDKFREEIEKEKEFRLGGEATGEVPFSELSSAGCYLDFIFPCLTDAVLISPEDLFIKDVREITRQSDRRRQLLLKTQSIKRDHSDKMIPLSERLSRSYPYQYLSNLFVKTTVSELKKKAILNLPDQSIEGLGKGTGQHMEQGFVKQLFEEQEIVPYIPSFISSKEEVSGTDRGSAYHKAMELLDFVTIMAASAKEEMEAEINCQLDRFEREEVLDGRWRKSLSSSKLMRFFESSLAARMAKADATGKLKREQPFVLGFSADRLGEQFPDSEQVLIQGIIDVFFEEDGNIIVADYKTDVIKTPQELVSRYQTQLDYYAEALSRLTGKKVTQKILYSFALGEEILLE